MTKNEQSSTAYNQWIITAVLVVVIGVAAFFGGMQYQKMQRVQGFGGRFGQYGPGAQMMGQGRQGGNNTNARPVAGQIISADDKSITVKMQDGSSKIVLLSDSTAITEATSAGKQALTSGKQVVVFGNTNSDGSVTATNVQLNPQLRMGRNGGGPGAAQ